MKYLTSISEILGYFLTVYTIIIINTIDNNHLKLFHPWLYAISLIVSEISFYTWFVQTKIQTTFM